MGRGDDEALKTIQYLLYIDFCSLDIITLNVTPQNKLTREKNATLSLKCIGTFPVVWYNTVWVSTTWRHFHIQMGYKMQINNIPLWQPPSNGSSSVVQFLKGGVKNFYRLLQQHTATPSNLCIVVICNALSLIQMGFISHTETQLMLHLYPVFNPIQSVLATQHLFFNHQKMTFISFI